jgi:hypothetical protein
MVDGRRRRIMATGSRKMLQMACIKVFAPITVLVFSLAFGFALALSGCSGPEPVRYSAVATHTYLAPNTGGDSGTVPYRYDPPVDWRSFDKAIIDPVVVYRGSDQQFGALSDGDKQALARYMQARFTERMKQHFTLTGATGPSTLRLHLILTGAETNTPVLSTLWHLDVAGSIYDGLQAAIGGEGVLTGSVSYVVEIFDAETSKLLDAYITKQYPGPYDLAATMGLLTASEVGIDKGADALIRQLN